MSTNDLLEPILAPRLAPSARAWIESAVAEVGAGADEARFAVLLSAASRHARRTPLAPSREESARAAAAAGGLEIERWNLLETLRVRLVLARRDLDRPSAVEALESLFRHADEGELCALYRSLALLPDGGRFTWRAGEGCRTNMRSVFEAVACDTPFPARRFDEAAFNQCAVKAIFIGAPLWRVQGLDRRLSPELARMALDLADERRSAGRPVQHELWLALGAHGGARALESIERELDPGNPDLLGRAAAAFALVRAGERERLGSWLVREPEGEVAAAMRSALAGPSHAPAFRAFDRTLAATP
jgi:hypothetical protein